MSPADNRWKQILKEIEGGRASPSHRVTDLQNSIARRLKALGGKGHCSPNAVGWIQARRAEKKSGKATKIDFKDSANGRDSWGHPAVRLRNLKHLADGAVLTVSIDVDERSSSIKSYSVSIQGELNAPAGDRLWYARIDLTENPEGAGICGHPLLHCHVGSDPHPSHALSPRVPLPWLHPADAFDWLLATVEPALEPQVPQKL